MAVIRDYDSDAWQRIFENFRGVFAGGLCFRTHRGSDLLAGFVYRLHIQDDINCGRIAIVRVRRKFYEALTK